MLQYSKGVVLSAMLAMMAVVAGSWSAPAAAVKLNNCYLEIAWVSIDNGVTYAPQLYIICDEGAFPIGP